MNKQRSSMTMCATITKQDNSLERMKGPSEIYQDGKCIRGTRKASWRRHCGLDEGKEGMRYCGTICVKEDQCHIYCRTRKVSRLEIKSGKKAIVKMRLSR
jgi:hypothetical protein